MTIEKLPTNGESQNESQAKPPAVPPILTLDEPYAIEVISRFFPSWKELQSTDIKMSRIVGGYLNTVYSVCRKDESNDEPSKVLLRRYGGTWIPRDQTKSDERWLNTEAQEVLIFNEMSRNGYGPKLLGVFDGGRVEELLEGHTLTPEHLQEPEILKEVANAYARMHSLSLPLPIQKDYIFDRILTFPAVRQEFVAKLEAQGFDMSFLNLDTFKEAKFLKTEMARIGSRVTLNQVDTNFLNVFVKDKPLYGQFKVALLDYEMSKNVHRGFDIGGHFVNTTIKWAVQKNKSSGHNYPSIEHRKKFIEHYLAETKRLGHLSDFSESGLDSVEHVLQESILGSMSFSLFFATRLGQKIEQLMERDEGFAYLVPQLMSIFKELNDEYHSRHLNG